MPAPYGFGVGDFVAVGTLAWQVYKSCKGAPESFGKISTEVLSLQAVLKEAEENLFAGPLSASRQAGIETVLNGCKNVLTDLQSLIGKYESLGTQAKRTWDRMRWGTEDIAEMRSRLTSSMTSLTAFISTSQPSVEQKLDKLIEEFRQGKKEGSVISVQTVDSLTNDDRNTWRAIRKELNDIGITVAAFDANRDFIFSWFIQAVSTGAFEEERDEDNESQDDLSDDVASLQSNAIERVASDGNIGIDDGENTRIARSHPLSRDRSRTRAIESGLKSAIIAGTHMEETGATSLAEAPQDQDKSLVRTVHKDKTRISRVAALVASITGSRRRLLNAVENLDSSRIYKILNDGATVRLLDQETLDDALWSYSSRRIGHFEGWKVIVDKLLEHGANINIVRESETLLMNFVRDDIRESDLRLRQIQWAIDNGVDVNYRAETEERDRFALRMAVQQEDQDTVRKLLAAGASLNDVYRYRLHFSTPRLITLLHEASLLGLEPRARFLIDKGASVDAWSDDYGTPLMLALRSLKGDVARLLIEHGANVNLKPNEHTDTFFECTTPIEQALAAGRASQLELLFEHGAILEKDRALEYIDDIKPSGRFRNPRGPGEYEQMERILRKHCIDH